MYVSLIKKIIMTITTKFNGLDSKFLVSLVVLYKIALFCTCVYLFDVEVVHEHTRVITELVRSDGG